MIGIWAGWLGRASNYGEPVLNHPRASSPLIWSRGAQRGPVILQSTWDAGLKSSALGCVAKTTKQNFLKYKWASKSYACFCPVVHSDLLRAPFSGPQVSSNEWIYKADINASWRMGTWGQTRSQPRKSQCQGGISILNLCMSGLHRHPQLIHNPLQT